MIINKYKNKKEIINNNRIKNPKISIVYPTYNEEEVIENTVKHTIKTLKKYKLEIIIVDDKSKDKTPKIIDKLGQSKNIVAIHRLEERGLLSAFQEGFRNANGKAVIMMDCDLSHPPELIPKMVKKLKEYDIVTGSRFMKGGCMKINKKRKILSMLLNKFIGIMLGIKLTDFTGNFHSFKKGIFESLEFKTASNFGDFDMELIYRASKKGYKMLEIPFIYKFRERGASKLTNIFSFGVKYLKKAIVLRFKNS